MTWKYAGDISSQPLNIPCPDEVKEIFSILSSQGYRAMIVGGAVRDAFLGLDSKDIDIEVYGAEFPVLQSVISRFAKDLESRPGIDRAFAGAVGRDFVVIKFTIMRTGGVVEDFDFSLPRRDSKKGVGHRGFEVVPDPHMSPTEASSRRDFTINSMGYDPLSNEIFDPFDGRGDIERKMLKATSQAFAEDPVRVLRGMQFSARFGFELDPETAEVCRSMLDDVYEIDPDNNIKQRTFIDPEDGKTKQVLATERMGMEWGKLFTKGKYPGRVFKFLVESGWIEAYPEIKAMLDDLPGEEWSGHKGVPQEPEWHPEILLEEHIAQGLDYAAGLADSKGLDPRNKTVLLLSTLCHDLGKPSTTKKEMKKGVERITSSGHAEAGVDIADALVKRMGIDTMYEGGIASEIKPLVRYHMVHIDQYKPSSANQNILRIAEQVYPSNIDMLTMLMEVDHSARVAPEGSPYPSQPQGMPEAARKMREDAERRGVLEAPLKSFFGKGQKSQQIADMFRDKNHMPYIGRVRDEIRNEQLKGDLSKIQNETHATDFARRRSAELAISSWIDTKADIIDRLGIDPSSQGPMIGQILRDLAEAYSQGLISTRDEALSMIDNQFGQQIRAGKRTTLLSLGAKMPTVSAMPREKTILDQLESGDPDWGVVASCFRSDEQGHVADIRSYFEQSPEQCVETYREILDESLMERVASFRARSVNAGSYDNHFELDTEDPLSEVRGAMGNSVVEGAVKFIEAVQPGALAGIVHVGVISDDSRMGVFSPDYDAKVKAVYLSQVNPGIEEGEIVQRQKDRAGMSFLINAGKIAEKADGLLPASYSTEDEILVRQIVLAEILLHEAVHATGAGGAPQDGEKAPVKIERDFLAEIIAMVNEKRSQTGEEELDLAVKA